LVYKNGIWRTKLAFRLQICSFQFTNKHFALQTGTSDYNSAAGLKAIVLTHDLLNFVHTPISFHYIIIAII
ncbi:MAG: hypothetical protein IK018_05220, partial [Lachnospiraceae bacterium]|nr:hypothetical protein [Lachnospiraceae bacterium]